MVALPLWRLHGRLGGCVGWQVLPTLISVRLAMSLTVGAYSSSLDPTNEQHGGLTVALAVLRYVEDCRGAAPIMPGTGSSRCNTNSRVGARSCRPSSTSRAPGRRYPGTELVLAALTLRYLQLTLVPGWTALKLLRARTADEWTSFLRQAVAPKNSVVKRAC